MYILPKHLDGKVARLHLGHLRVKLTRLTKGQADYVSVPLDGPYNPRKPVTHGWATTTTFCVTGSAPPRRIE